MRDCMWWTLQAANSVEYVLRANSLVEMHTWLSAVQQCMTAETVNTETTTEPQSVEPLVPFGFI